VKLQAYSVHDVKSESFAAPFFVPKEGIAVRVLTQMVADERTDVSKFPADYFLYHVGSYDTDKAVLESLSPVVMVCSASSVMKASPSAVVA